MMCDNKISVILLHRYLVKLRFLGSMQIGSQVMLVLLVKLYFVVVNKFML